MRPLERSAPVDYTTPFVPENRGDVVDRRIRALYKRGLLETGSEAFPFEQFTFQILRVPGISSEIAQAIAVAAKEGREIAVALAGGNGTSRADAMVRAGPRALAAASRVGDRFKYEWSEGRNKLPSMIRGHVPRAAELLTQVTWVAQQEFLHFGATPGMRALFDDCALSDPENIANHYWNLFPPTSFGDAGRSPYAPATQAEKESLAMAAFVFSAYRASQGIDPELPLALWRRPTQARPRAFHDATFMHLDTLLGASPLPTREMTYAFGARVAIARLARSSALPGLARRQEEIDRVAGVLRQHLCSGRRTKDIRGLVGDNGNENAHRLEVLQRNVAGMRRRYASFESAESMLGILESAARLGQVDGLHLRAEPVNGTYSPIHALYPRTNPFRSHVLRSLGAEGRDAGTWYRGLEHRAPAPVVVGR